MSSNIKKGVLEEQGSTRFTNGQWLPQPVSITEVDYIEEKDVEKLKDKIRAIKTIDINLEELKAAKNVYFQQSALFPRSRFKEISNSHVTRDPAKADFIILNTTEMLSSLNSRHWNNSGSGSIVDGVFRITKSWNAIPKQIAVRLDPGSLKIERDVSRFQGAKFISDEDLVRFLPNEGVVEGNLYENLNKMLSNKDPETVRIGARILSGLKYEESKIEIVLLLNQYWTQINYCRAATDVPFKSMLRSIDADFQGWRHSDNLQFILELAETNSFSERVLEYVNSFLNKRRPLKNGKKYKIIVE